MVQERVMIVGLGEVGLPLFELLKECNSFQVYGFDIDKARMSSISQKTMPDKVDILHICIPCINRDKFVSSVENYVNQFEPKLVIINSTVSLGATQEIRKRCNCLVAHSPVRGIHRNFGRMKQDLKLWTKYVGGVDEESGEAARKHLERAKFKTRILKGCGETELAKLFETTYRAWMIACFQEMHRISRQFETDFNDVVDFLEDTHRGRFDRPVMFPGVIGGHCLIPNAELLLKSYDSEFIRLIFKSNEMRKKEIRDQHVMKEVEEVKKRVKTLNEELQRR
ncbi:MAG: GDP-mannose dehydrogenase [Candidatus Bathyarchaeota archaeon]|nr:MAG: GDP-mannose dehydrogenase [Candidatus Bathyarchaeota archaeon]